MEMVKENMVTLRKGKTQLDPFKNSSDDIMK
jgi:hypothetical protein